MPRGCSSGSCAAMSRSTDNQRLAEALTIGLSRSVLKRSRNHRGPNAASCAISRSGKYYIGGTFESDTNLFDIPSEHVALLRAVQQRDLGIREVVTRIAGTTTTVSPLVLKLLVDFGKRTGRAIAYRVFDERGRTIFRTRNAANVIPFYRSAQTNVGLPAAAPQKNWQRIAGRGRAEDLLRTSAMRGLRRAFPLYPGASAYGASALAKSGNMYYSGQYSASEQRLGLHAEMAVLIAAVMEGERDITHLGLVSDKFEREPPSLCGACRQFVLELSRKFGWHMAITCFAKHARARSRATIGTLLPGPWESTPW